MFRVMVLRVVLLNSRACCERVVGLFLVFVVVLVLVIVLARCVNFGFWRRYDIFI